VGSDRRWSTLWRRGKHGWPSRFVLVQIPNGPLLCYFATIVIARLTTGRTHDWASAISIVALTIWAYEEAARGANWFRRGLGVAVLADVTISLAHDLG